MMRRVTIAVIVAAIVIMALMVWVVVTAPMVRF